MAVARPVHGNGGKAQIAAASAGRLIESNRRAEKLIVLARFRISRLASLSLNNMSRDQSFFNTRG